MLNLYFIRQVVTGMITCFVFSSAAAQAVDLKLNLTKGELYRYDYEITLDQTVGRKPSNMVKLVTYTILVAGEEGNNKVLECSVDRLAMNVENAEEHIVVNTDSTAPTVEEADRDQNKVWAKMLYATKGQSFSMQVNEQGKLSLIKSKKTIVDNIIDSASVWFDYTEDNEKFVRRRLTSLFSEEAIIGQMQQSFDFHPGKPVQVGASWSKTIAATNPKSEPVTVNYTVKAFTENEVILQFRSNAGKIKSGNLSLLAEQWGEMTVDRLTGMLDKYTYRQNSTGRYQGSKMIQTGRVTITRKAIISPYQKG